MGRLSIIFLLMICSYVGYCVPAYPHPIEVRQPDGSRILLLLRGDERCRYMTNIMGDRVSKGVDGFYRPSFSSPPLTKSTSGDNNIRLNTIAGESVSALIIPAEFKDVKFRLEKPADHFQNMINGDNYAEFGATGSVKRYFEDNLKGRISLSFDVSKVVSLSKNLHYYGENKESRTSGQVTYDVRVEEMIREACSLVNKDIDFSKYNYVFIYFAGYSEAEGGDPSSIWPVSLDLSTNPIALDGARITSVGCASELRGVSGKEPSGIGAFCHEFGHILGLPDLYDVDYDENGRGKGMWGTLSLMDYGCYNNQGRTPPYFNAIEREILGVEGERLVVNTLHNLEPIHLNERFYRVNTKNEGEYFLLEVRQESGWDSFIGGEGLLVYHIDKSSNPAGMIQANVRWENNLINTFSEHECADLVEAELSAVSVRQLFFPGLANIETFATLTNPHFVDWDMRGVGIKLEDITLKGDGEGVSFMVSVDNDEILLTPEDIKVFAEQRMARISWSSPMNMGAKWGIRWGSKGASPSDMNEKMVNETKCTLDNLKGGEKYECQIYHIGYLSNGDTVTVKFKTQDVTSPFPYIHGIAKPIHVGDTVSFKIYNLNESEKSISWYQGGRYLPDGLFVFDKEGKVEVKAEIEYVMDGSRETIVKTVLVNQKEGDYEDEID